jgi:large conductance mechanosensitive channel
MLKKFLKEFRDFAEKGSAIDMAVGVIAGAAMTGVVNSLVKDVMMPPIGILLGGMDFSQFMIVLKHAADGSAVTLNIGLFVNAIISFIITMFAVFLFVRVINKLRAAKVDNSRECPYCYTKISVKATKCPNCCSDVKPVKVAAPKSEDLLGKLKKIVSKK